MGILLNPLESARAQVDNTPWSEGMGFQNLVFGASTTTDVLHAVGKPPDNVLKNEQIYPVVENYYFGDDAKTGAATVFVFENNLLVGMLYKSPDNQFVDLTYMLPNIGDRMYNANLGGGMMGFYPNFPLYAW